MRLVASTFCHQLSVWHHLQHPVQVWLGFSQSLRACETGLTLNVDVASTAFVTAQPMVEFVARVAGVRPDLLSNGLSGNQLRAVTRAALNLQVGR